MTLEVNIKTVSATVGIIVTVGALFLGAFEFIASKKHEPIIEDLTALRTQMDILMEERMVVMERNSLWVRMRRTLDKSDESIIHPDKFTTSPDYFPNQAEKLE